MGKLIEFDEQRFRELCNKGLTFEEIGRQFGAKATWACKKAKALGIKKERKTVKVTWNLTPNSTPEYLEDGVSRLVRKRNGILLRFLETGDLSEARAYCAKYKVPVPRDDDGFRRYLRTAARTVTEERPTYKPARKARKPRASKFTKEQLQPLIEKGMHCDEIAEELNCSKPTVWKWCKKYNLPNPARRERVFRPGWQRLDQDELQKLCDQKLTIEIIARKMGVGPNIVRRNIKEYGIERESLRPGRQI